MSDVIEAFEKWANSYPKIDGGISLAKAKDYSHFTYVTLLPEFGFDAWQAALAQAGAVVPEWMYLAGASRAGIAFEYQEKYCKGWNDCRAAMLSATPKLPSAVVPNTRIIDDKPMPG
jgi:hypothetical protein